MLFQNTSFIIAKITYFKKSSKFSNNPVGKSEVGSRKPVACRLLLLQLRLLFFILNKTHPLPLQGGELYCTILSFFSSTFVFLLLSFVLPLLPVACNQTDLIHYNSVHLIFCIFDVYYL